MAFKLKRLGKNKKNPGRTAPGGKGLRLSRRGKITLLLVIIAAALIVGGFFFFRYRKFTSYSVVWSADISNTKGSTRYFTFADGFIQYSGDGLTYITNGSTNWNEALQLSDPVIDKCGKYIAVGDQKGSDIYIYDTAGYLGKVSISHELTGVSISDKGIIAALSQDSKANYIDILDKNGEQILTVKTLFNGSGYPMSLSLSPDGTKLIVGYLYLSGGSVQSKVVFYDLSDDSKSAEDRIAGGFNQYTSTMITNVKFMDNSTAVAAGDNMFSIYRMSGSTPSLVKDVDDLPGTISSLYFSDSYIGFIFDSNKSGYLLDVYNLSGQSIFKQNFDFNYNDVKFSGSNTVISNDNECLVYSIHGILKFDYTFDDGIEYLGGTTGDRTLLYATANKTELIKMK